MKFNTPRAHQRHQVGLLFNPFDFLFRYPGHRLLLFQFGAADRVVIGFPPATGRKPALSDRQPHIHHDRGRRSLFSKHVKIYCIAHLCLIYWTHARSIFRNLLCCRHDSKNRTFEIIAGKGRTDTPGIRPAGRRTSVECQLLGTHRKYAEVRCPAANGKGSRGYSRGVTRGTEAAENYRAWRQGSSDI